MGDVKRILWPSDLSETSRRTLPAVTSLAATYGAELHLLHIAPDMNGADPHQGSPEAGCTEDRKHHAWVRAQKELAEICREEGARWPSTHVHVEFGDPAKVILKIAGELRADLIVLLLTQASEHPQVSAVAREVLTRSTVPVIAISPTRRETRS